MAGAARDHAILLSSSPRLPPTSSVLPPELALQRRHDWTPPPNDTVPLHSDGSSAGFETWSSPNASARNSRQVFASLRDSFGCKEGADASETAAAAAGRPDVLTKRKAIEAISIGDSMPAAVEPPSPEKPKRAKKKPRTITELAMAAYADSDEAAEVITTSKPAITKPKKRTTKKTKKGEETGEETAAAYNPGHPASKLRKGLKLQPKAAPKRRKKPPASQSLLLSPRSAMEESQGQDFVFGTSSQLVREDSPEFLRNLHAAMQSSNCPDDDSFFAGSDAETTTKLWAVSARGMDGRLSYSNVIDLEDDIAFPEDPDEVAVAARRAAQKARETITKDVPSSAMERYCRTQTANAQSEPEPEPKAAQPETAQTETAQPARPVFETCTTAQLNKQVSSYGYKPIRDRRAMIALLHQCWDARCAASQLPLQTASLSTARTKTTEAKAAKTAKTAKAAKSTVPASSRSGEKAGHEGKRGGGDASAAHTSGASVSDSRVGVGVGVGVGGRMSVEPCIFEIEDSESDGRLSGAEDDRRSQPQRLSQMARSSVVSDSESITESADSASDAEGDDARLMLTGTPTLEEATLFEHITQAVTSAPRSTDLTNPSWHEKMLMYDTIILETFTAWLNDGPLQQAGYAAPVDAHAAKKWCESKSVCCTWKINMHGKERKL